MNSLFYIAIMLLAGVLFGRLVKQLRLPNVTGYLIAGLVIGPQLLNIIPTDIVSELSIFSDVALGFIAFSVGGEFKMSYLKRLGKAPMIIAIFEALLGVVAVFMGLLVVFAIQGTLNTDNVCFALVLSAIAAATAPAATILIIKQYNSKGKLTDTLLSVVALDDAVAIILFGLNVALANAIGASSSEPIALQILRPIHEIASSLVIGGGLGALFCLPLRWFKKDGNRMCFMIAAVFLGLTLSNLVGGSSLLCCMALGIAFVNIYPKSNDVLKISDYITPPIFVIFFVQSGAALDVTALTKVGLFGVVYILMRVIGKFTGAYVGSVLTKQDKEVKNYLGFTLFPQAGVAIGLSLVAQSVVPQHAEAIRAIVLSATFVYEIVGPVCAKIALQKGGNIIMPERKKKVAAVAAAVAPTVSEQADVTSSYEKVELKDKIEYPQEPSSSEEKKK